MAQYRPRILDELLVMKLCANGAVLVQGPKACGKTTTALQLAKSSILINTAKIRHDVALTVDHVPQFVLGGDTPRLIGEWQNVPRVWNAVRHELDKRGAPAQFILTGSAVPDGRADILRADASRFGRLTMRPMSLYESGASNGAVSLEALFRGSFVEALNPLAVEDVASAICRGGWPEALHLSEADSLAYVRALFAAAVKRSAARGEAAGPDEAQLFALLRACAQTVGTQTSLRQLEKDIATTECVKGFSRASIETSLKRLKRVFVLEDVPAWAPKLRAKTPVRTTAFRYFVDPSFAAAALEIGPRDLFKEPRLFYSLFENLCMRDLLVYADPLRATIFHYRDKNNLSCDAAIERQDGSYALIEIKLGGEKNIEQGAAALKKLVKKLARTKPAFLMVLVGAGDCAYQREDGVFVVPIGCLRP